MRLAAAAAADDLMAEIRLASRLLSIQVSTDDASGSNLGFVSLLISMYSSLFFSFLSLKSLSLSANASQIYLLLTSSLQSSLNLVP